MFSRDFPGGSGVKNPPWNADSMGLIPGEGIKIPPSMQQLSPSTTAIEPVSCSGNEDPTGHKKDLMQPNKYFFNMWLCISNYSLPKNLGPLLKWVIQGLHLLTEPQLSVSNHCLKPLFPQTANSILEISPIMSIANHTSFSPLLISLPVFFLLGSLQLSSGHHQLVSKWVNLCLNKEASLFPFYHPPVYTPLHNYFLIYISGTIIISDSQENFGISFPHQN